MCVCIYKLDVRHDGSAITVNESAILSNDVVIDFEQKVYLEI